MYYEKQEISSTVWITYNFVGESLLDKYKRREDPRQSRYAKVLLGTILAWGNRNLAFVRLPLWGDYSVHLGFWEGSGGADSDVIFTLLTAIQVADLGDQSRTIESESLQNLL